MSRKNRNNKNRKARNKERREELRRPRENRDDTRASRKRFVFRARGHAEPVLDLTFSGVLVPCAEGEPAENLVEQTKIQQALWDSLPDGEH